MGASPVQNAKTVIAITVLVRKLSVAAGCFVRVRTFVSGGQVYYEAFKTCHSDGTESENANLTRIEGNVCVGYGRPLNRGVVHLNHVGWNFDGYGNLIGTVVITETNVVARNGKTYQGTFNDKFYDLNGNLICEVPGTQTATRITPKNP